MVFGQKELSAKRSLIYCNDYFIQCINQCYNITKLVLTNYNMNKNVMHTVKFYVKIFVKFSFACDHKEDIIDYITSFIIIFCIFNFCKYLNNIMNGKEERKVSSNSCTLVKAACDVYNKRKYRSKF